jgi:hypothetical protein
MTLGLGCVDINLLFLHAVDVSTISVHVACELKSTASP